jgi:phosphopentomutase
MKTGKMLEERNTFADIGATILDNFNLQDKEILGTSIFNNLEEE